MAVVAEEYEIRQLVLYGERPGVMGQGCQSADGRTLLPDGAMANHAGGGGR